MTIIKTPYSNKKAIIVKLGFVVCLIFLGLVSYGIATGKLKEKEAVLGKKTQIQNSVDNLPGDLLQKAQDTAENVKNNAYQLAQTAAIAVGNIATQSAQTAKDFVFDNTVGSAVKQINNLPQDEQNKIKEYICK